MILHRFYLVSYLMTVSFLQVQAAAPPGPLPPSSYKAPGASQEGVLPYYHSLNWLKTYAAKLEKRHADRLPEARQPLRQIQSDAVFLQQKWLAWPQRHPGQILNYGAVQLDSYFSALEGSKNQLRELQKASDEEILRTVKAVASDLHAKAENCRYSTDGLGKNINVTVHTKKGTAEVPGYEVYCAPVALVKFKDEHIRFPRMSSSQTVYKNLAPGHYAMWLQKENEKTEPVAQTIGGHGEKELEIDLPVPAESSAPK